MIIDFYYTGDRLNGLKSLIRHYPSYSYLRLALKIINGINQITFKFKPKDLNLLLFEHLNFNTTGNSKAFLTHKFNQNNRIYIIEFNKKGPAEKFIKFTNSKIEKNKFRQELKNLNYIKNKLSFSIGNISSFIDSKNGMFLIFDAISNKFEAYNKKQALPDFILKEIENLRPKKFPNELMASEIMGWRRAIKYCKNLRILNIVRRIKLNKNFRVVAAHCDLGSENIYLKRPYTNPEDFIIIDWEYFNISSPELTDRVSLWLGQYHLLIKKKRKNQINKLTNNFLSNFSNHNGGVEAAVLAILFLANSGLDLAQILICYSDYNEI